MDDEKDDDDPLIDQSIEPKSQSTTRRNSSQRVSRILPQQDESEDSDWSSQVDEGN